MTDEERWDVTMRMRRIAETESAALCTLAATIAAGIEANCNNADHLGNAVDEDCVAKRALRIACEIVKAVAP